ASATDPAAFASPTSPEAGIRHVLSRQCLCTTTGRVWATYSVAAMACSALGSYTLTVPPRDANINAMRRPRVPAPNTATGRFLMSAKVCSYDIAASLHRVGVAGQAGQWFVQVGEHVRIVGPLRRPSDRNYVDSACQVG